MADKQLFLQNVIAIIWDFDKTLCPDYMQKPLFNHYAVSEQRFWDEVRGLPAYYKRANIHISPDTAYLGHLLSYVKQGKFPDLTNARLRELGRELSFFAGVPEVFTRLKALVNREEFAVGDAPVSVEHYVVSTGLKEMIMGSAIAPELAGVWASEFIEDPAQPGEDLSGEPRPGPISQIATFLDNTTKTRAIFEINKGVNKQPGISVNDTIPEEERRVPVRNMIYVADGPSDIPSFSVIRKHGGRAYAVYDPASKAHFAQADDLMRSQRIDAYGPADYREGQPAALWLERQVEEIARRIAEDRKRAIARHAGTAPKHL